MQPALTPNHLGMSGRIVLMSMLHSPVADPRLPDRPVLQPSEHADPLAGLFGTLDFDELAALAGPHVPPDSQQLSAQGLNALGFLGLMAFERGQLRAAEALCDEGISIARQQAWTHAPPAIVVNLVIAMIQLERNQLAEAQRSLDACQAARGADSDPAVSLAVQVMRARLLLAWGRVDRAGTMVTRVQESAEGWEPPDLICQWLTTVATELDLANGRPGSAFERARSFLRAARGSTERMRVLAARAELARGHTAEVETFVAPVREESRNPMASVEAWLVTAVAADQMRNDHQALTALDHAVTFAEREDLRRPFLALRHPRVEPMLRHAQRLAPDRGRFTEVLLSELDSSSETTAVGSELHGPLTDREQLVLRHLATLQTSRDIAADLYISVNTVKAHTQSVYRKLAVCSRRDAVGRARELGFL